MPAALTVPFQDYLKYRRAWVLYRNLGSYDHNGNFHPPISFYEGLYLPQKMLDVFFELDIWIARLMKQAKKKSKA
jgi:hypothetical protein